MITLRIDDYFDCDKIMKSGQCFRVRKEKDGYFFIHKNNWVVIRNIDCNTIEASCTKKEWDNIWHDYFDMDKDYKNISKSLEGISDFSDKSIKHSKGIRILKQDKFETLISFIISQRKSIPSISSCIEKIAKKYGEKTCGDDKNNIHFFPNARILNNFCDKDLDCSLGYRDEYVRCATREVFKNKIDLDYLNSLSDECVIKELLKIKGVGLKVASCVALFAYNRLDIAPQDVWINRIIEEDFMGISPFIQNKKYAGVLQQYLFFYKRFITKGAKIQNPRH